MQLRQPLVWVLVRQELSLRLWLLCFQVRKQSPQPVGAPIQKVLWIWECCRFFEKNFLDDFVEGLVQDFEGGGGVVSVG